MRGPRLLVALTVVIAALALAILVLPLPLDTRGHLLVRWTARTSFVMFALAYVARPLVQLRPSWRAGKWLLAERKWLGLGFAVSHLVHLIGILILALPDFGAFVRSQQPTILVALATFVLVFAMAITSIEGVKRRMSARAWKSLHRTGMHFAWLSFTATYAGLVAEHPGYAVPALVLLAIAATRCAALVRGMRRRATGPTSRSRARHA